MNEELKKAKESFGYIKEDLDYFQPKGLKCRNRENQYKQVENALNQAEEHEKELNELKEFTRIVFEKNVFIWGMAYRKKELKDYKPTYEYYKSHCGYFHSGYTWELMTEKEFELVKKVVSRYE